jgi:hypothetical protein
MAVQTNPSIARQRPTDAQQKRNFVRHSDASTASDASVGPEKLNNPATFPLNAIPDA